MTEPKSREELQARKKAFVDKGGMRNLSDMILLDLATHVSLHSKNTTAMSEDIKKNFDGKVNYLNNFTEGITDLFNKLKEEKISSYIDDYLNLFGPNTLKALEAVEGGNALKELEKDLARSFAGAIGKDNLYDHKAGLANFDMVNKSKHNKEDHLTLEKSIGERVGEIVKADFKERGKQCLPGIETALGTQGLESHIFKITDQEPVCQLAAGILSALMQRKDVSALANKDYGGRLPSPIVAEAVFFAKQHVAQSNLGGQELSGDGMFKKGQEMCETIGKKKITCPKGAAGKEKSNLLELLEGDRQRVSLKVDPNNRFGDAKTSVRTASTISTESDTSRSTVDSGYESDKVIGSGKGRGILSKIFSR